MTTSISIRIGLWVWLIASLLVGRLGLLAPLLGPALQGLLLGLTAITLVLYFKVRSLRMWIDGLDLRLLVLPHVSRFIGFYFLFLHQRGELPYAFAVPGGWGDNLVAFLALPLCLLPMADTIRRRAITIWNVVGFMDILMVVITAGRLGLEDPSQMRAFTYLPLSLLPTFLVPLIITTHVIIFLRLRRETATT